jgi:pimeloyl-ACP methyl ester carboxylesterase
MPRTSGRPRVRGRQPPTRFPPRLQRLAAGFAALFPSAMFVVQPDAGHSPWLDDASWFQSAVTSFLDEGRPPGR